MMNHLTKFWKKAKDEDGNEISQDGLEDGFNGTIYFGSDNYIEICIKIDDVTVHESYLDRNQEYMYDAFVEYVQQEMRDAESTSRDIEETNQSLMYDT